MRRRFILIAAAFGISLVSMANADVTRAPMAPAAGVDASSVDIPLLPSGPDPWVIRDGKDYYYMSTLSDRLAIRKTHDLRHLADAAEVVIWSPPEHGPNAQSIWAPELHRIKGRWYIYYTAAESGKDDDDHRGVFVLENASRDPTQGKWIDRGKLKTAHTGIDGTTFLFGGTRYFVYSAYVGPDSVLSIVAMANPWTLKGRETIIARPDHAWERQGGRQILEGPAFLPNAAGRLLLSYSGSACWSDDYAIGLLSMAAGRNPLDPASWEKKADPVFAKSASRGIYAPGHNGFFTTSNGESWMIYHANPRAGMECTAKRAPHIQRVNWKADGMPVFD